MKKLNNQKSRPLIQLYLALLVLKQILDILPIRDKRNLEIGLLKKRFFEKYVGYICTQTRPESVNLQQSPWSSFVPHTAGIIRFTAKSLGYICTPDGHQNFFVIIIS